MNRLSSSSSSTNKYMISCVVCMQRHVSVQVSHCRSTSTLCNKEHCDDAYTIMTMIPFRHLHFHVYILSMSSLRACRLDWMGWDWRCKRLNFNWLIDKHTLFDWLNEFCSQCWAPLKMRHSFIYKSMLNYCRRWAIPMMQRRRRRSRKYGIFGDNSVLCSVRVSINTKEKRTKRNKYVCK